MPILLFDHIRALEFLKAIFGKQSHFYRATSRISRTDNTGLSGNGIFSMWLPQVWDFLKETEKRPANRQ